MQLIFQNNDSDENKKKDEEIVNEYFV